MFKQLRSCEIRDTRVREMIKYENKPLKKQKWASAAQKHKVGHPG